jgi:PAS domain S-box-containing protein
MLISPLNIILFLIIAGLLTKLLLRNRNRETTESSHHISADDLIWKSIIQLTNPDALHANWHVSFNQVQTDICTALEADKLFLLDINPDVGSPLLPSTIKDVDAYAHNWILSVPKWMSLLERGENMHDISKNLDIEEQAILEQEGIHTLLLIPLIISGKLIAIIGACRYADSRLFNRQQINSLRFMTNILTMAISNQHDRSERDRLVTVVEQSSDCIIITSSNGTILYANGACEEVTGFLPTEITGQSIKILYPPQVRKKLWQRIKTDLKKGNEWSGQFANNRQDGTLYEEEMQISPVYSRDGKVANQVIVKRDITEEKRLESIAEAANLMENIGFIFSSIRHELGNPINSIKVSLSILENNLDSYDKDDIKRFVSRSLFDIGRVEYLLRTLKNFSVFERPDIQQTDMSALLQKLVQLIEKDLAAQYIMLAIIPTTVPLTGYLDPRAFLQVLLNLITNAVAAMKETDNKTITISLRQKQAGQIIFTVKDNGTGMDEAVVRNLFRPFFTTKAEGTGLGLVIVKKMLSKMNCSISASSVKGKGTCMEIIIPSA